MSIADLSKDTFEFEKMCNFAAVSDIRDFKMTLNNLILQCLILLPEEEFTMATQLKEPIKVFFNLEFPDSVIENAVAQLIKENTLFRLNGLTLTVDPIVASRFKDKVRDSKVLEMRVKNEWFTIIESKYPHINLNEAWLALQEYLICAFRRHGIQTLSLLKPSINKNMDYNESLSFLLDNALKKTCLEENYAICKKCISDFFSHIGLYPDRIQYVTQLADGAFSFFSFAVAPEAAEQFRRSLNQLSLFLDTNFLFGILNLHEHPSVDISNVLLKSIEKYGFPFNLYYHEATKDETSRSIAYYSSRLRERHWDSSFSKVAITSPYISGIELKYHKLNSEFDFDVDSFLAPFKHFDVLLEDNNISLYSLSEDRTSHYSKLQEEYKIFLKNRNIEKPDSAIEHDSKLLDTVRLLRSQKSSSLDAGALLITCDFQLFRFDWDTSRHNGTQPCVVLPNMFWQILRPFIPPDNDFDRSFAATFAIPEFRTISSGAARACSKMLSLLASYENLSKETAYKLLSNKILIDQLRTVENNDDFKQRVESFIVNENLVLSEENLNKDKELQHKSMEIAQANLQINDTRQELFYIQNEFKKEKDRSLKLEVNNKELMKKVKIFKVVSAILLSMFLIPILEFIIYQMNITWILKHSYSIYLQILLNLSGIIFVVFLFYPNLRGYLLDFAFSVNLIISALLFIDNNRYECVIFSSLFLSISILYLFHRLKISWLLNHSNSYSLQTAIFVLINASTIAVFYEPWRKISLLTIVIPCVFLLIKLLGGPNQSNKLKNLSN
jgi:hypothetical protein